MPGVTHHDPSLHLPRILCLHGGGTNAQIFKAQCRGLTKKLKTEFRFVFAQAPFSSNAGSDVLSVYSQWGPFRRWLRWRPEHPRIRPDDAIQEIDNSLEDAIRRDDECGATGDWIALLGFSQGAKVSASLLYRQQLREEAYGRYSGDINFRFGILLAGRAPLISLDNGVPLTPPLPDASEITDLIDLHNHVSSSGCHLLSIPTVHVHGVRDKGLDLHRQLFNDFCDPGTRRLIEWDGGHRLPLKSHDVSLVADQIRRLAEETGVY